MSVIARGVYGNMEMTISYSNINGQIMVRSDFLRKDGESITFSEPYVGSLPPDPAFLTNFEDGARDVAYQAYERLCILHREIDLDCLKIRFRMANIDYGQNFDTSSVFQFQFNFDLSHYHITREDIGGTNIPFHGTFELLDGREWDIRFQWEVDVIHPTETVLFTDLLPAFTAINSFSHLRGFFGKLKLRFHDQFLDNLVIQIVDATHMRPISINQCAMLNHWKIF